jgi:hypothetical protein
MASVINTQYNPNRTLPELVNEVLNDLYSSYQGGNHGSLRPLRYSGPLLSHLNTVFRTMFDTAMPGYDANIQSERAPGGARELYLAVMPSINRSGLAKVFIRNLQITRLRIGLLKVMPCGQYNRYYEVHPAPDEPAAELPVNKLLPYISLEFLQGIRNDVGGFAVISNYLNELTPEQQTALSKCAEGIFGGPKAYEQGASAMQVFDPNWRSGVCQELTQLHDSAEHLVKQTKF